MKKREWAFLGVRVPKEMANDIDVAIESAAHASRSEFIRDAIRKELERLQLVLANRGGHQLEGSTPS